MRVRWLLVCLALSVTVACGGSSQATSTADTTPAAPSPPPVSTPSPTALRDEVLLDLVGTGELSRSRAFTSRGASVNICWQIPGGVEANPPDLTVRLHDAASGEERFAFRTDRTAAGCRAAAIRSVGQPHFVSVTAPAGAAWHIAVVGQ